MNAFNQESKKVSSCSQGCSRRQFMMASAGLIAVANLPVFGKSTIDKEQLSELQIKSKIKVGKMYVGIPTPGWPMHQVDLNAEVNRYEQEISKLSEKLADIEFIDVGLVSNKTDLAKAKEKLKDVTGILVLHLTLGTGNLIYELFELNKPVMIFTMPYCGHEWHIVPSWQREGKPVDIVPSSQFADIVEAIKPFRAIQRLMETRILHVNYDEAEPKYCTSIKEKFGTQIISIRLPELQKAYEEASEEEVLADANRWIQEAEKIVEPTNEEIKKAARMYIGMKNLMRNYGAQAITMNCLGMGLIDKNMGYPCLGFVRLNNVLLAGVCEADLKSTMTQLLFSYLVGRTGFVTDPMFDISNSTIIHAHCVAATQMKGPDTEPSPYIIRSHLEDNRGVSLQVRMPVGEKVTMARLIGTDFLLYSVGEAIDSPLEERGCRSKLTVKVENVDNFLYNWSSGLHRVIIYGDHTRDVERYCRLMKIKILREGIDNLHQVEGLLWNPYVHA
ncbi:MAG: hypothetical protein N3G21_02230 [Candidatus Hydrogenedentes bacterium]|nr:hypothetical protein [Candidatus Hydrogenedentota bacterium]